MPTESNKQIRKREAREIAYRVIRSLTSGNPCPKYYYQWMLDTLIKEYTNDHRLIRESNYRIKKALINLGFTQEK